VNPISDILLNENDLESSFYFLGNSGGSGVLAYNGRRVDTDVGQCPGAGGETGFTAGSYSSLDLVWSVEGFEEGMQRGTRGEDPIYRMGGGQSGLEKELGEGIEILGIVIAGIRYLAPREPIPCSEYLFNYHVC